MNYENMTDAQLDYIARDAFAASEACKDHDEEASCKYLDQMLEARSELRRRVKK